MHRRALALSFIRTFFPAFAAVMCLGLLGSVALQKRTPVRIGLTAVAGSVLFFAVSNFGVWALGDMYPHNIAGLVACYVAAIPFFQNTLAGDLFYATLLFGGFRIAELLVPQLEARGAQAA